MIDGVGSLLGETSSVDILLDVGSISIILEVKGRAGARTTKTLFLQH